MEIFNSFFAQKKDVFKLTQFIALLILLELHFNLKESKLNSII